MPEVRDDTTSKIQPYEWRHPLSAMVADGYMDTADTPALPTPHRIYWAEYGNPKGEPVMFLHGGPGGGITDAPDFTRFFNPQRYRIILFDQRGCGRSTPSVADDPKAGLANNETDFLIKDIFHLRQHLGITGKMHVFGGSWGSTLAMVYAIAHPETVATLILRGVCVGSKRLFDYFYQGNATSFATEPNGTPVPGTYMMYPEVWKPLVEMIPPEKRGDMVKAYAEIFAHDPQTDAERDYQQKAASAWTRFEGATSYLKQDLNDLGKFDDPRFGRVFAMIENHYFMNGMFLGGRGEKNRENTYILDNVSRFKDIPVHIVHGRYDQVCPLFEAEALVAAMAKLGVAPATYSKTAAGHSMGERENAWALTAIMDKLPPLVN